LKLHEGFVTVFFFDKICNTFSEYVFEIQYPNRLNDVLNIKVFKLFQTGLPQAVWWTLGPLYIMPARAIEICGFYIYDDRSPPFVIQLLLNILVCLDSNHPHEQILHRWLYFSTGGLFIRDNISAQRSWIHTTSTVNRLGPDILGPMLIPCRPLQLSLETLSNGFVVEISVTNKPKKHSRKI
jgi:hypothetical protein